jgi:hypothetical protein
VIIQLKRSKKLNEFQTLTDMGMSQNQPTNHSLGKEYPFASHLVDGFDVHQATFTRVCICLYPGAVHLDCQFVANPHRT